MSNDIIDLNLIRKLTGLGGVSSQRAIHYKGFVVNETYLSSEQEFLTYCSNYAFDQKKDKSKRKVALELSSLVLNGK